MKTCRRCQEVKPFSEFYKTKRLADGHAIYCKQCTKSIDRQKYERHFQKYIPKTRERYRHNRDSMLEHGHYYRIRVKYGLSKSAYARMTENQLNLCAICHLPETSIDRHRGKVRKLSVDHDHQTGEVRELLCGRCNRVLGMLFDSIETIDRLYCYLLAQTK